MSLAARFFNKVALPPESSGCWEWTGSVCKKGYGRIGIGGKKGRPYLAHRVSYETWVGPIPEGLIVCHRCDNPRCVNPLHLFLGTHQDNSDDKLSKSRGNRGMKHGNSKLTEDQVRYIREAWRPQKELARKFNVSQSLISQIQNRKIWTHLEDE